jgi:hypothetical protein
MNYYQIGSSLEYELPDDESSVDDPPEDEPSDSIISHSEMN